MPQLPQPLRWDHNAHYHRWLLHQLPPAPQDVLDVGCGAGGLAAKLAARAAHVDAVDVSAPMIARARARHATTGNIRWLVGDLLDPALPVKHEGYDVVTALSSVHHMPLQPVLGRLEGLVRPGGVLAVIGFYRQATLTDRGIEAQCTQPGGATVDHRRTHHHRHRSGLDVHRQPRRSRPRCRPARPEQLSQKSLATMSGGTGG